MSTGARVGGLSGLEAGSRGLCTRWPSIWAAACSCTMCARASASSCCSWCVAWCVAVAVAVAWCVVACAGGRGVGRGGRAESCGPACEAGRGCGACAGRCEAVRGRERQRWRAALTHEERGDGRGGAGRCLLGEPVRTAKEAVPPAVVVVYAARRDSMRCAMRAEVLEAGSAMQRLHCLCTSQQYRALRRTICVWRAGLHAQARVRL